MAGRAHLTTEIFEALQPGQKIWDDTVGGLYCAAGKESKRFGLMANYPAQYVKPKGTQPKAIEVRVPASNVKDARTVAQQMKRRIAEGLAPLSDAAPPPPPSSLGEPVAEDSTQTLLAAWATREKRLAREIASGKKQPRTLEGYLASMARLKPWQDMTLKAIRTTKVDGKILPRVIHEKLSRERGGRAADAALGLVKMLYGEAAIEDSDLPAWPAKLIVYNGTTADTKERAKKIDLVEWNAARLEMPDWRKRLLLLLTLAVGARKSEMLALTWADVNLAAKTVHFAKPKGGPRRAYTVPLSPLAVRCFEKLRQKADARVSRVWHAPPNGKAGWPATPKILRTPHVLRSKFISMSDTVPTSEAIRCAMRNHTLPGAHGHYSDVSIEDMRPPFNAIGAMVESMLGL